MIDSGAITLYRTARDWVYANEAALLFLVVPCEGRKDNYVLKKDTPLIYRIKSSVKCQMYIVVLEIQFKLGYVIRMLYC